MIGLLLAALLVTPAVAAELPPGPFGLDGTLEQRLDRIERAYADRSLGVQVQGYTWDDGDATVELRSGLVLPLRIPGTDATVGFWFGGDCTYEHTPRDAGSRRRLQRELGVEAAKGRCTEVVRLGSDVERFEQLLAAGRPRKPRPGDFEDAVFLDLLVADQRADGATLLPRAIGFALLSRAWGSWPADHERPQRHLLVHGPAASLTSAFPTGLVLIDQPSVSTPGRTVGVGVTARRSAGSPVTVRLRQQRPPGGDDRLANLVADRVELSLDLTPSAQPWLRVDGTARFELRVLDRPQSAVELQLPSPGPAGQLRRGHVVRSVVDGEARSLPFVQRSGRVLVVLAEALLRDQAQTLTVTWDGVAAQRRGPGLYTTLAGGRSWPAVRPFGRSAYRIEACVPEALQLAAGGRLVGELVSEGRRCSTWEPEAPVMLPRLAVGEWAAVDHDAADGQRVRVRLSERGAEDLQTMAAHADRILQTYGAALGPLPWTELVIAEGPQDRLAWTASSAFIELVGFDSEDATFAPDIDHLAEQMLAHEIAHQWFGNGIRPFADEDDWLSESVAEYLSWVYLAVAYPDGKDAGGQRADWWVRARKTDGYAIADAGLEPRQRQALLYRRGPLAVMAIAEHLGHDRFLNLLGALATAASGRALRTDDFAAGLSKLAGEDVGAVVDQWIRRPDLPALRATWVDGVVRLEQTQPGEPFLLTVPL